MNYPLSYLKITIYLLDNANNNSNKMNNGNNEINKSGFAYYHHDKKKDNYIHLSR